jgi:hypothetical protein
MSVEGNGQKNETFVEDWLWKIKRQCLGFQRFVLCERDSVRIMLFARENEFFFVLIRAYFRHVISEFNFPSNGNLMITGDAMSKNPENSRMFVALTCFKRSCLSSVCSMVKLLQESQAGVCTDELKPWRSLYLTKPLLLAKF